MYIYFMRHGETDWNKQGRLQGSVDIPLNEHGIELTRKTRAGLEREGISFDKAFTSPYCRARQTAQIIMEGKNIPIVVDPRLREMCFGAYEGMKVRELMENPKYERFAQYFNNPVSYVNEGTAESYEEAFMRASGFLQDKIIPLEGSCEKILVVCHGAIIRAFLCIINNIPLEKYWTISQPNCCVNIAVLEREKLSLLEEGRLYYEQKQQSGRMFV